MKNHAGDRREILKYIVSVADLEFRFGIKGTKIKSWITLH